MYICIMYCGSPPYTNSYVPQKAASGVLGPLYVLPKGLLL